MVGSMPPDVGFDLHAFGCRYQADSRIFRYSAANIRRLSWHGFVQVNLTRTLHADMSAIPKSMNFLKSEMFLREGSIFKNLRIEIFFDQNSRMLKSANFIKMINNIFKNEGLSKTNLNCQISHDFLHTLFIFLQQVVPLDNFSVWCQISGGFVTCCDESPMKTHSTRSCQDFRLTQVFKIM